MTVVRRYLRRLLAYLDPDNAVPVKMVFYSMFIAGGLYGQFVAFETPRTVEAALGGGYSIVWLWLIILGPSFALTGQWIKRCPRSAYGAIILQFTGDIAISGALLIYVIAMSNRLWATEGSFAIFVVSATMLGSITYAIGDGHRLARISRIAKRQERR